MKNIYLLQLGVTSEMDAEIKRVTILSNAIYIVIGTLLVFYVTVNIPVYLSVDDLSFAGMVPFIIIVLSLLCLLLNHLHQYIASKLIFIIGWAVLVIILPYALYGSRAQDYILHPIYCIITSVMIHLLFSYQQHRLIYLILLTGTWLMILFSVEFVSLFRVENDPSPLFKNGFFGWRLLMFMFAAFFNASLMYVLYYNQRFYNVLKLQKEKMADQNQMLQNLTAQLEGQVVNQSQSLIKKNETLSEYTFFNSHVLRAPVSRILGLINLLAMNIDKEEEKKVKELLSHSMNELDEVIKKMNQKLVDTHYDQQE